MLEEIQEIILDNINATSKTISIALDTIVKRNGDMIAKSRQRRAFVPGQILEVMEYTGWDANSPEIIYLNSIWTSDAIQAYNDSLVNNTI